MSVIVAGKIYVKSDKRDDFIKRSIKSIETARQTEGCIDFAVSLDPIEPNRINIFEHWTSDRELQEFRGKGPDTNILSLIERADVSEHIVKF